MTNCLLWLSRVDTAASAAVSQPVDASLWSLVLALTRSGDTDTQLKTTAAAVVGGGGCIDGGHKINLLACLSYSTTISLAIFAR